MIRNPVANPDPRYLRRWASVQQVPKFVPVALDRFKPAEMFALGGRKTGNEGRSLTPIMHEMRCKPDREASSKTYEEPCPEHFAAPIRTNAKDAALK
jgi:hypothetical protein